MLNCKTINIECQPTSVNLLQKADHLLTGYAFFQHLKRSAVFNILFFLYNFFFFTFGKRRQTLVYKYLTNRPERGRYSTEILNI